MIIKKHFGYLIHLFSYTKLKILSWDHLHLLLVLLQNKHISSSARSKVWRNMTSQNFILSCWQITLLSSLFVSWQLLPLTNDKNSLKCWSDSCSSERDWPVASVLKLMLCSTSKKRSTSSSPKAEISSFALFIIEDWLGFTFMLSVGFSFSKSKQLVISIHYTRVFQFYLFC